MGKDQLQRLEITSIHELQQLLAKAQISYMLWHAGRKNEQHLFEEIQKGEAEIVMDPDHGLVRQSRVLNVEVRYKDQQNSEFILVEDRQVWHSKTDDNGQQRVDRRGYQHISEKLEPSEVDSNGVVAITAIRRALNEELGVTSFANLSNLGTSSEVKESPSYPGLKTKYIISKCRVYLPKGEFKKEYQEKGKEKTTYFAWKKIR